MKEESRAWAQGLNGGFRKLGGTLLWGPYKEGSYYLGYYIRVPYFRNLPNWELRIWEEQNPQPKPDTLNVLGFRV